MCANVFLLIAERLRNYKRVIDLAWPFFDWLTSLCICIYCSCFEAEKVFVVEGTARKATVGGFSPGCVTKNIN